MGFPEITNRTQNAQTKATAQKWASQAGFWARKVRIWVSGYNIRLA
jgi:hypothetical protein